MGEACQFVSNRIPPVIPILQPLFGERTADTWYALKVRTGSEASVVNALQSRGLHSYCPTHKERRRYTDRMKVVDKPLFAGYVFCAFLIEKKLPIVSCPGVDYIVGFAGAATVIPQSQIENIRRMVEAGAVASERFVSGDRVRVTHGPLAGVEGILVREARGNRLVVSIELLNQAASVYIGQDQTSVIRVAQQPPVR